MSDTKVPPKSRRKKFLRLLSEQGEVCNEGNALDVMLRSVPSHVKETIISCLSSLDTDTVRISTEDIHYYLDAAEDMPGLSKLKDQCEDLLLKCLNAENAVYMLHMADEHALESLSKEAKFVICGNLGHVASHCRHDLKTLEKKQIQEILEVHISSFANKEKCMEILEMWSDNSASEDHEEIRQFVESVFEGSHHTRFCKDRKFHLSFTVNHDGFLEVIVRDVCTNKMYHTDCNSENGKNVKIPQNFALCSYQEDSFDPPVILICGGTGELACRQTVECDVVNSKWKLRKPMNFGRERHSLCVVNSKCYAIGGFVGKGKEKQLVPQVEEFDRTQNAWKGVTALPIPVYCCAVATVGNKIFIIGGKNIKGDDVPCIQLFDALQRKVTDQCELPSSNECFTGKATVVESIIYFANCQGDLLQINTKTMQIEILYQQPEISKNFTLFPLGNRLLITYHKYEGDSEDDDGRLSTSYIYMIPYDRWMPYDERKVASERVSGQCSIIYPAHCQHIPFCD